MCRKSWSRTPGSAARERIPSKCRLRLCGSIGVASPNGGRAGSQGRSHDQPALEICPVLLAALCIEPGRRSLGRCPREPGVLDYFSQFPQGEFADPARPQQHRWVPVEVRCGEERRRLILNQCLLVRLGGSPEHDHVRVALPGFRIDGVGTRVAEGDRFRCRDLRAMSSMGDQSPAANRCHTSRPGEHHAPNHQLDRQLARRAITSGHRAVLEGTS